jgi:hypothetical protein
LSPLPPPQPAKAIVMAHPISAASPIPARLIGAKVKHLFRSASHTEFL